MKYFKAIASVAAAVALATTFILGGFDVILSVIAGIILCSYIYHAMVWIERRV